MIKEELILTLAAALERGKETGVLPLDTLPTPALEMPKNREHGDWATNIALVLAPVLRLPPREVAGRIVGLLPIGDGSPIAKADIAGPGFINLTLRPDWLADILKRIEREDDSYGSSQIGAGRRVLVEFVSVNPNGPVTVAGGRNAAIGDVVASLLAATGFDVAREYYINDALNSTQMNNFGRSVFLRYLERLGRPLPYSTEGDDIPDWLYQGEYVGDVAGQILTDRGEEFAAADIEDQQTVRLFRDLSEQGMIAQQKADLDAFGVRFDRWFSEATLHEGGQVAAAIAEMTQRGETYEKDGALWLRSTNFGDDKDRVLMRADGTPTYIAGDAAYHKDKLDRGFAKLINVWGADHAGYIARTKSVIAALGYDSDRLDVLLYQLVRIVKNGMLVQSSKRRGNVLELKADLIDEIGKDAARFYFLMRSPHTELDIDVDLAKKTEKDNPVYYVQYAHARIVQTLEKAREEKAMAVPLAANVDLSRLSAPTETDLIKKLSDYPDELRQAAQEYAPQRITQYVRDLAAVFHTFYDAGNRNPELRVVCDDAGTMAARLVLVNAARIVLLNALSLLGVSAPDRM